MEALTHNKSGVLSVRNRVVHQGEEVDEPAAQLAIDCAQTMRNDIVRKIAKKFGFTLERTGCWCKSETDTSSWGCVPWDPIEGKKFFS